jgi:hypothetical protein
LLFELQPARTIPYTPIEAMAKMARMPTLTSDTCSLIGSSSHPNSVVSAPNGTTANAAKAVAAESTGASANSTLSAPSGRNCSLNINLITSANGCRSPRGPTR